MKHFTDPVYDGPPDLTEEARLVREAGSGTHFDFMKAAAANASEDRKVEDWRMAQLMRQGVRRWFHDGLYRPHGFVATDEDVTHPSPTSEPSAVK